MLQWLCVGWILGLTTMGWSKTEYQLSAGSVCLMMLLWLLIYRVIHSKLHQAYLRVICITFSIGLSFLLGQGFANHALDQRLQFIEKEVEQREVIVYISRLNKINTNSIQQPLQILQADGTTVQWLSSLKPEGPVQTAFNTSKKLALGQYYRLTGEIRPVHAYATPGAFDVEKWYLEQNLMAGFRIQQIQPLTQQEVYALGFTQHLRQQQSLRFQFLLWIEQKRLELRAFIYQQPIHNKGLMLALLTGDESLLDPAIEQQFRRFGMSHLLAISGPHVVIFALIFCASLQFLTARLFPNLYLKWPRQYYLSVPFLLCVLLYCAFVGFEIPALRTLLICVIITASIWLRQYVQPLKLLILSAAILLLLDSFSILSAAFWLSYGACFVLLRIYQTIQRQPHGEVQNLKQRLYFGLKVLIESQWKIFVALFPLMILFFKQLAWIAPLSNLFAIPWIGLLIVPLDIIAALFFFIAEPLAALIFQINDLMISILLGFLNLLDSIFSPELIPVAMTPWLLVLSVIVLLILFMPQGAVPKSWAACGLLPIMTIPLSHSPFQLHVLDVGQGQSIFIRQGQHNMMIDTGGNYDESRFSVGEQIILPFLSVQGISKLDQLILTHLDQDHSGAYMHIRNQLKVKELMASEQPELNESTQFKLCQQGQTWNWNEQVYFQVLSPQSHSLNQSTANKNENSCVIHIQVKDAWPYQHFLLMGDAGWETEFQLLKNYPNLKVDVLVLGHHGSQHSSAYQFLQHYRPKLAIASAGRFNRYGHPSQLTRARLQALNIPLLSTPEHGSLEFQLKDKQIQLASYRSKYKWLQRETFKIQ
ncbi:DNA internalization-related competence protein ComEC/Rec2 [Acinetobacter sp. LoGeW2-3]|uniref:DNA internalization-related competence protein ComEC/Rec2 n=1 Tax=Acinetobacter sp. LoGeW2-3 TaxID=1808001 RepID=UPI000C05B73C|nr:DNA internalization-related competence protein ComEC/Rec2 [Acinetobacter sp. LoGeW2-3]ATO19899.1 DNA internalization-related competence protein ComEC/Rec2 [Acinetobacter sp. LoGeW2-3]